ncbi:hypothetical protein B0H17DRAFT_1215619 [Mycena rosella]|uniref:Uncharacterized protein n=1 Tax=Mycena rosella TaxID=1033263 RepID=A0AAD7FXK3_MYCRO|nr:hypothetical protein B0H17DRAFT_1215619 [Mycena rosella]
MAHYFFVQQPTWDDRAVENSITIWDRWESACDSCGRLKSSLKEEFMSISPLLKDLQDKCQDDDWSRHKEQCHLFEINRTLSDVYSVMEQSDVHVGWCSGSGINDPTRSLETRARHWESLHRGSLSLIQSTIFENKKVNEETPHLGVFLKLVGDGPVYDYRSFVIDKVALIPFSRGERKALVLTGYCMLSGAKMPPSNTWFPTDWTYSASGTSLPPGFDLHRFITHVNRGITHFHGSYCPLPRKLSDAAFEAAEPPKQWLHYMRLHHNGFQSIDRFDNRMEVFGVVKRDGTQVPLYDYNENLAKPTSDALLEAMTEVDPTEFKKFLDDPDRQLCIIPRPEKPREKRKSKGKQGEVTKKLKSEGEEDSGEETAGPVDEESLFNHPDPYGLKDFEVMDEGKDETDTAPPPLFARRTGLPSLEIEVYINLNAPKLKQCLASGQGEPEQPAAQQAQKPAKLNVKWDTKDAE